MPERIQLRRTKGWRKPEGSIVVARPSKWGNPFTVHVHTERCGPDHMLCPIWVADDRQDATTKFRHALIYPVSWTDPPVPDIDDIRNELRGHDLACWCPLDQPCHADVLLEICREAT